MEFFSALLLVFLKWPILLPIMIVSMYYLLRNRRFTQETADRFFSQFKIGGHRGSPQVQPENTIASMEQAKREGADLIEFDVSLTKDGIAVILHDDTLDRTTNMTGAVRDFLFKDLSSCNCAAKFKPIALEVNNNIHEPAIAAPTNNEPVILPMPTLEELVQWAKKHEMRMLFDVKDADKSLVLTLEHLFEKYDIYERGIVCSFFPTVVYWLKRHQPKILTGLTWRRWFFSYADLDATVPRFKGARLLLATAIDVLYHLSVQSWLPSFLAVDMILTERRDISSTFVKQQEAAKRRVCAWTVNDLRELQWMRNVLNIPVLTDIPALVSKI
ncbi:Glycerophosphodiester phosphodiesterase 1 [Aphelenchoides besseyi]|nr:Glycerophosphodiester phosphodiesterase 1 [Aphelenchoides besseyi]KAI6202439.1 Glycerophosphodiester phosphodiesterase 1 [Aphelenchoides besseyi]